MYGQKWVIKMADENKENKMMIPISFIFPEIWNKQGDEFYMCAKVVPNTWPEKFSVV